MILFLVPERFLAHKKERARYIFIPPGLTQLFTYQLARIQAKVAELRLLEQDTFKAAEDAALEYRNSAPVSVSLHPEQGCSNMTTNIFCLIKVTSRSAHGTHTYNSPHVKQML